MVSAGGIFDLCCGMWDLVPWPGIKPEPPALGVRSLSHWTTREVPVLTSWCNIFSYFSEYISDGSYFFLLFPMFLLLLLGPMILFVLVSFFHIWHFALWSGDPWLSLTFKSKTRSVWLKALCAWMGLFLWGTPQADVSKSPLWSGLNSPLERESPGAGAERNRWLLGHQSRGGLGSVSHGCPQGGSKTLTGLAGRARGPQIVLPKVADQEEMLQSMGLTVDGDHGCLSQNLSRQRNNALRGPLTPTTWSLGVVWSLITLVPFHGEVPRVGLTSCVVFAPLALCRMGAQICCWWWFSH